MLILSLLIALIFSLPAFAEGGPIDIGGEENPDVGAGSRDWGYNYWAGGYRTYMEGEGGKLV